MLASPAPPVAVRADYLPHRAAPPDRSLLTVSLEIPPTEYGAVTMKDALAATITTLPDQLRRSITWDRDKERSAPAPFKIKTGIAIFFADPQAPRSAAPTRTPTVCFGSTSRRHRPRPLVRRDRRRRRSTQRSAPQDPWLEDTSRSPRRVITVSATNRCCDESIKSGLSRFDVSAARDRGRDAPGAPGRSTSWHSHRKRSSSRSMNHSRAGDCLTNRSAQRISPLENEPSARPSDEL